MSCQHHENAENICLAPPKLYPNHALGHGVDNPRRGKTRQDTVSCYTYRNTMKTVTDRTDHPSKERLHEPHII